MAIFEELAQLESRGTSAVLCTVTASQGSTPRNQGSKMLVYPDGRISGTIGGGEMEGRVIEAALAAFENGRAETLEFPLSDPGRGDAGVCGGTVQIFVEPILPAPTALVIGGGHVGKAVVHLAKWLGYRVELADDRPEFCSEESVPDADVYRPGPLTELLEQVQLTDTTYVILTTRNVLVDKELLPALIAGRPAYLGVIGSKRRWETTRKILAESGVTSEAIDSVVSPMGLELQAETPEEIAVSIMAEIMMLRNGASGQRMRSP
jgi:xanthine dehydrogenase accessory factor